MESISPGLAVHKGSRGQVLLDLKKDQPLTSKELADRVGVSSTAIRRHLKELEAEGLVRYGREQRGHGAPTFAYRLSETGEALFPNRYEETVTSLLKHLVENEGRPAAVAVVEEQYSDLKNRVGGSLAHLDPVERLNKVSEALGEVGYMAETIQTADGPSLSVHNCVIHAVASYLPEVCEVELNFLKDVLGADVERKTHIVEGCNACEYHVSFTEPGLGVAEQKSEKSRG